MKTPGLALECFGQVISHLMIRVVAQRVSQICFASGSISRISASVGIHFPISQESISISWPACEGRNASPMKRPGMSGTELDFLSVRAHPVLIQMMLTE